MDLALEIHVIGKRAGKIDNLLVAGAQLAGGFIDGGFNWGCNAVISWAEAGFQLAGCPAALG